ncbi:UNVERIFIED_CONTAM: hypothetical protein GTU68_020884 [Idotea baltica]|nr:hypothetical protein [Idotea baltica]
MAIHCFCMALLAWAKHISHAKLSNIVWHLITSSKISHRPHSPWCKPMKPRAVKFGIAISIALHQLMRWMSLVWTKPSKMRYA